MMYYERQREASERYRKANLNEIREQQRIAYHKNKKSPTPKVVDKTKCKRCQSILPKRHEFEKCDWCIREVERMDV